MKHVKLISVFLVFFLISGSVLFAQQEEKARENYKKALELYKVAKQYVYAKEWKKATEYFQRLAKKSIHCYTCRI